MLKFLNNMSLRKKILILSATFFFFLFFISLFFYLTLSELKVNGPIYKNIVQSKDIIADILPPPEYIIESYLTVMQMQFSNSRDSLAALQEKMRNLKKEFETRHAYWNTELQPDKIKKILTENSYRQAIDFYTIYETEYLPLILKNEKDKSLNVLISSLAPKYELHRKEIDTLVGLAIERNQQDEKKAEIISDRMAYLNIAILIIAISASIFLSFYLFKNIRMFAEHLQSASNTVSSATMQFLAATKELQSGVNIQGDSVHSIKASIQEMSVSMQEVSATSLNMQQTSISTRNQAEAGLNVVKSVNSGMNEINAAMDDVSTKIFELTESSKEIGKIVRAITNISEQTNLLALNAAIEAARAGDYGRGFAVVADEVRNLADRSNKSAMEIADIIGRIQSGMSNVSESMHHSSSSAKNGIKFAEELDTSFQKIRETISTATDGIEEMVAAITEQASAGSTISSAIEQVSDVVNKTSASSAQLVTQGEHLTKIANTLNEICGRM